jgi:hypothetical protein
LFDLHDSKALSFDSFTFSFSRAAALAASSSAFFLSASYLAAILL